MGQTKFSCQGTMLSDNATYHMRQINLQGGSVSNPGTFPSAKLNEHFFFVHGPPTDRELFYSNGSDTGTGLFLDLNPNGGSMPSNFFVLDEHLFFTCDDGVHGVELWVTDGSRVNTKMVLDILPGADGSWPKLLFELNGALYFRVVTEDRIYQLWKTDSVMASMVKDSFRLAGLQSHVEICDKIVSTGFLDKHVLWAFNGNTITTIDVVPSVEWTELYIYHVQDNYLCVQAIVNDGLKRFRVELLCSRTSREPYELDENGQKDRIDRSLPSDKYRIIPQRAYNDTNFTMHYDLINSDAVGDPVRPEDLYVKRMSNIALPNLRDHISVYPNPSKDEISISVGLMLEQNLTFEIFNLMGQRLGKGTLGMNGQIRTDRLPAGHYVLLLKHKFATAQFLIVKS